GEPSSGDLLEGVDLTWSRVQGGDAVRAKVDDAIRAFDVREPSRIVPALLEIDRALDGVGDADWASAKRRELHEIVRAATGLWIEALATRATVVPGEEIPVVATAIARAGVPVTLESVRVTHSADAAAAPSALPPNEPVKRTVTTRVPAGARYTQPFWLEERPGKGRFTVADRAIACEAEGPPALAAKFALTIGGRRIELETPVAYRWVDPVRGELEQVVEIVPPVTVEVSHALVFPDARPRAVRATVRAGADGAKGTLRLRAPAGWAVTPAEAEIALAKREDEREVTFTITPPEAPADATLSAEVEIGGARVSRSRVRIDHPHVRAQTLFPPADVRLVRVDVARVGSRVGYVEGAGDEVPGVLEQLGYDVAVISDEELERGDLAGFDAIVTGVRAYNVRPRMRALQPKLLRWVEDGGTLVVQYNTSADLVTDALGPFPLQLSRDRVTVEEAPVRLVVPEHAVLRTPNRIGASDFDGWVQERGLYFAGKWDPRYEAPLSTGDPGEPAKEGSLLVARHGKGVFVYTSLAFFRQLPAGVPGALRLFANLVSARADHHG
ncbi:MAG TPA: LmbE family protein, partial [Planctomycetota bacterium]|nr:LmbE family protein [Planctomycetota bacterium]